KSRRSDLGGLEVNTGAGIAEGGASSWLGGIVVIEAELGGAAVLGGYVALTSGCVGGACTLTAGGDARYGRLPPGEVADRSTGMVIRESNVDAMARVHRDLEEVGEAAVGAAGQSAGRDATGMVGVIGGLAQGE